MLSFTGHGFQKTSIFHHVLQNMEMLPITRHPSALGTLIGICFPFQPIEEREKTNDASLMLHYST